MIAMSQKTKYCRRCDSTKTVDEFYNDKNAKDGKCYECKVCVKKRSAAWQKANPEKARKRQAEWAERNQDKYKATLKRYHSLGGWRRRWYMKKYGLTPEQVQEKIKKQDNKCAICGTDKPGGRGNVFAVDHNHRTGKTRMMLCQKCNTGLGSFNDSDVLLMKAAIYLMDHNY